MNLTLTPTKRAKSILNHESQFFRRSGLNSKYIDLAVLEWTRRVPNMTALIVWPEAVAIDRLEATRAELRRAVGDGMLEKTVRLTRQGLAELVLHAYGDHPWVPAKARSLGKHWGSNATKPVCVFFVRAMSGVGKRVEAKRRIRDLYGIGWVSRPCTWQTRTRRRSSWRKWC